MKKLIAIIMTLTMCFAFVGCGGESGGGSEGGGDGGNTATPQATSIVGGWECVDAEMTDAGSTFSGEEFAEMMGMKLKDMLSLSAYGDGSADMAFMGDEATVRWEEIEKGKAYLLIMGDEGDDQEQMDASLADNQLTISMTDSYTSDGKEVKTEMKFIMEYQGMVSRVAEGYNLDVDNEMSRDMSNFMLQNYYIISDGVMYGLLSNGNISCADVAVDGKKIEMSKHNVIKKDVWVDYLCQDEDYIYGSINTYDEFPEKGIMKLDKSNNEFGKLTDMPVDYFQLFDGKFYFTDENDYFCSMDTDGKNKKTILEKKCFYTYVINDEWMSYQDDADGETIHLYNFKTKKDYRVTEDKVYVHYLAGEYMYYTTPGGQDGYEYDFKRINMYSGKVEKADGGFNMFMFIADGKIYFDHAGCPNVEFKEWDQLWNKIMMGSQDKIMYMDDELKIIRFADGVTYAYSNKDLSRDNPAKIK